MNDTRLSPDDPKLTAYALGELSGDQRATVEAALRQHPELRAVVDEIRTTAGLLESALASETIVTPPASEPRRILFDRFNGELRRAARTPELPKRPFVLKARKASNNRRHGDPYRIRSRGKLLRFPQLYYVAAAAAVACFALRVGLREERPQIATVAKRTITPETTGVALPAMTLESAAISPASAGVDVKAVGVASDSTPVTVADPNVTGDSAAPRAAAVPGPVFVEENLSLVAQVKRGPDHDIADAGADAAGARSPRGEVSLPVTGQDDGKGAVATSLPVAPADTRVAGPVLAVGADRPTAQPPAQPPTRFEGGSIAMSSTLFLDGLKSPLAEPVVAVATPPSIIPGVTAFTPPAGGATTSTLRGDIVVLSAFTVNANRLSGFAVRNETPTARSDKRGNRDRDERPSPPPGAKFGRNAEAYSYIPDNDFVSARHTQTSTFSIDVDTASYANVRRILQQGSPPPRDAVRIEELVNYFPYRYAAPKDDSVIAASLEVAEAPWAPKHRLVRIGLKGREVPTPQRPPANLVFLLDVSGSMNQPNKLPLVKQSLRVLVGKLRPDDRVAIVTYAGDSGLALPSTPVTQAREILNALDALTPGGATNGAQGIELAYEIANANFLRNGINRVILCTDGDFNVGITSEGELVRLVAEKATSGVFLTVLGFGMGNYKDATLEKLANKGHGKFGYIDQRREAEKLLAEQVSSTLMTVAKDVKVEVEFNPALVSSYRLIGYENRLLRREDFNNDKIDAGELGAGHTVTALYEVVPVGAEPKSSAPRVDDLKYVARGVVSSRLEMPPGSREPLDNELLTVRVRYKKPDSVFSLSKALEFPLVDSGTSFRKASADFRFAAAVAEFGMILRGSAHQGTASMRDVAAWASSAAAPQDDPGGYRSEFIELVWKAHAMME